MKTISFPIRVAGGNPGSTGCQPVAPGSLPGAAGVRAAARWLAGTEHPSRPDPSGISGRLPEITGWQPVLPRPRAIALFLVLALPTIPWIASAQQPDRDAPETELASFKLPPGFEINLFASERDGVMKPIQMRWDARTFYAPHL